MKCLIEWTEPQVLLTVSSIPEGDARKLRWMLWFFIAFSLFGFWGLAHWLPDADKNPPPFWQLLAGIGILIAFLENGVPRIEKWLSRFPSKIRVFKKRIVRVRGGGGQAVASFRDCSEYFWVSIKSDYSLVLITSRNGVFGNGLVVVGVPDPEIKNRMTELLLERGIVETTPAAHQKHLQPVSLELVFQLLIQGCITVALSVILSIGVLQYREHLARYGAWVMIFICLGVPFLYGWLAMGVLARKGREIVRKRVSESHPSEN